MGNLGSQKRRKTANISLLSSNSTSVLSYQLPMYTFRYSLESLIIAGSSALKLLSALNLNTASF